MLRLFFLSTALSLCLLCTTHAQLTVDTDLGNLGAGTFNLAGDTATFTNEVDYYSTANTAANWGNEGIFQFTTSESLLFNLTSNAVTGDPDFFLLDGLSIGTDGAGKTFAENSVENYFLDGATPDSGTPVLLGAGTYYVSATTWWGTDGATNPADAIFDIDMSLEEVTAPTTVSDFGTIATQFDSFTIDTIGTSFDTELGLYDSDGNLLDTNDDIGGGVLQSELALANLNPGLYYVAFGAWNTVFADGFDVTTSATTAGDYTLNYDGDTYSGSLASGSVDFFSFVVAVPEPSSATIAGLALLGLCFSRRRTS